MGYKVFTPTGRADMNAADIESHNAELERRELAAWSQCPDRFVVYIDAAGNATTWRGGRLNAGPVTRTNFRTNLSRNMESVRFVGTNGATYHGRYGADWSQLCRVRKAK